MNFNFTQICSSAMLLALALAPGGAYALDKGVYPQNTNISQRMSHLAPKSNTFTTERAKEIISTNSKILSSVKPSAAAPSFTEPGDFAPVLSIGPVNMFGELQGPRGENWYYTSTLWVTEDPHYSDWEWYTNYILDAYEYVVYDGDFNEIGRVKDIMRYKEDETMVPGPQGGIGILPLITRNYFNSDDSYELAVCIAVNTTTPGRNNMRTVVYSLGGEKESVTKEISGTEVTFDADKPIGEYNGFVNDVLDASEGGQENYYLSFTGMYGSNFDFDFDKLLDGDPEEGEKYWQYLTHSGETYSTYAHADESGKLRLVHQSSVSYQQLQGDMEDAPPMMSISHNGQGYIVNAYYKDSFFYPYYSPYSDMQMRDDNYLVIELHKLSETGSELVQKTEIPTHKGDNEGVLCTYTAVGTFRVYDDIIFNEDGTVSFYISTYDYLANDSDANHCYYLYDKDGNKALTLFEGAERSVALHSIPGQPEQQLFLVYDDFDGYVYYMVDLDKGYTDKTVKINYLLDNSDDPEVLSFNVDRVEVGDSYKYAFEMSMPIVDDYDNDVMRIAWFDNKGKFDHIDYINMGKNVYYAMPYISGSVLKPNIILSDEDFEYMVLIKRGINEESSASQEELIIAQPMSAKNPQGRNLLYVKPCDKGALQTVGLYSGVEGSENSIMVCYYSEGGYSIDFYALPLDVTAIEEVTTVPSENSTIVYDGLTLKAEGKIAVFSTNGQMLLQGKDNLSTSTLPAGIYVVASGRSVKKFIVK